MFPGGPRGGHWVHQRGLLITIHQNQAGLESLCGTDLGSFFTETYFHPDHLTRIHYPEQSKSGIGWRGEIAWRRWIRSLTARLHCLSIPLFPGHYRYLFAFIDSNRCKPQGMFAKWTSPSRQHWYDIAATLRKNMRGDQKSPRSNIRVLRFSSTAYQCSPEPLDYRVRSHCYRETAYRLASLLTDTQIRG